MGILDNIKLQEDNKMIYNSRNLMGILDTLYPLIKGTISTIVEI